jgi:ribosomal protein S16
MYRMDVEPDRNPKRKGSPIDEGGRYRPHPTDQISRSDPLAQVFEKKGLGLMNRLKKRGTMSLALED